MLRRGGRRSSMAKSNGLSWRTTGVLFDAASAASSLPLDPDMPCAHPQAFVSAMQLMGRTLKPVYHLTLKTLSSYALKRRRRVDAAGAASRLLLTPMRLAPHCYSHRRQPKPETSQMKSSKP